MTGGTSGGARAGVEAIRGESEGSDTSAGRWCVCSVCVCCAHVVDEVHEGAAQGRSRVQPAELVEDACATGCIAARR